MLPPAPIDTDVEPFMLAIPFTPSSLTPSSKPSVSGQVGERILVPSLFNLGVGIVRELFVDPHSLLECASVDFYSGTFIHSIPLCHLQVAPPPVTQDKLLSLEPRHFVPDSSQEGFQESSWEASKLPLATALLRELSSQRAPELMDAAELCFELLLIHSALRHFGMNWPIPSDSWLPGAPPQADSEEYNEQALRGTLRYCMNKLRLMFGVAIKPDEVTVMELQEVGQSDDVMVADAYYAAGVDFRRLEVYSDVNGCGKTVCSFLSSACMSWRVEMLERGAKWGAYNDAILACVADCVSAYHTPLAAWVMELLIDRCNMDVNFDPLSCGDSKTKREVMSFIDGESSLPLLSKAIGACNTKVVEILLDRGADVNSAIWIKNRAHETDSPLKAALNQFYDKKFDMEERKNILVIVDMLLRRGASLRVGKGSVDSRNGYIGGFFKARNEKGISWNGRLAQDKSRSCDSTGMMNNLLASAMASSVLSTDDYRPSMDLLTKLLHLGKPGAEVVEEALAIMEDLKFNVCPLEYKLLEDYSKGKAVFCDYCEARACSGGEALRLCACRTVAYCGKKCQLKAWKEHRGDCGKCTEGKPAEKAGEEKKKGGGEKQRKSGRK
jgi:hypothetical protein